MLRRSYVYHVTYCVFVIGLFRRWYFTSATPPRYSALSSKAKQLGRCCTHKVTKGKPYQPLRQQGEYRAPLLAHANRTTQRKTNTTTKEPRLSSSPNRPADAAGLIDSHRQLQPHHVRQRKQPATLDSAAGPAPGVCIQTKSIKSTGPDHTKCRHSAIHKQTGRPSGSRYALPWLVRAQRQLRHQNIRQARARRARERRQRAGLPITGAAPRPRRQHPPGDILIFLVPPLVGDNRRPRRRYVEGVSGQASESASASWADSRSNVRAAGQQQASISWHPRQPPRAARLVGNEAERAGCVNTDKYDRYSGRGRCPSSCCCCPFQF